MCKPQNRTRVLLDESEIQRRLTRAARPTLAERYAQTTTPAERDAFYRNEPARPEPSTRTAATRPPTTVWITKPILKSRGWTETAIRDFLPRPESQRPNPHLQGRRPMPLWTAATIARAESTPDFQLWLRQSLTRRRLTRDDLLDEVTDLAFRRRSRRAANAIETARRMLH